MRDNRVTIKAMTDETVTVAGYGIVFGGEDLYGETFSKDTDLMLDLVPNKPVLYDHGMNSAVQKSIIGSIKADAMTEDETGLWVEAELARNSDYVEAVITLVEAGALGWSSGSFGQLADVDGKMIKRWPIVEFSLTPTPAEPRTLGVEQLRGLIETMPVINELSTAKADDIAVEPEFADGKTDIPEDARTASEPVPDTTKAHSDDTRAQALRIKIEMSMLKWRKYHRER